MIRKKFHDSESSLDYVNPNIISFPLNKSKHLTCPNCKSNFQLKDFYKLKSLYTPILLDCGHPICQRCVSNKNIKYKSCKVCNKPYKSNPFDESSFPTVHVYMVGLLNTIFVRGSKGDEPEFSFRKSLEGQIIRKLRHERCNECSFPATCKCTKCNILLCSNCYQKLHNKALKNPNHIKVEIQNTRFFENCFCQEHNIDLQYFCTKCDIPACANCVINMHADHGTLLLEAKNKTLWEKFVTASTNVAQIHSAVEGSLKNLDEAEVRPPIIERAERQITEHFAELHGLLQITERKLLQELHSYQQNFTENIKDIRNQLESYQSKLQETLTIIQMAKENAHKVNFQDVISTLNKTQDIPCCLVKEDMDINKCPRLQNDDLISIKKIIKDHSKIEYFDVNTYYLSRISDVPDSYRHDLQINDSLLSFILKDSPSFDKTSTSSISPAEENDSLSVNNLVKETNESTEYDAELFKEGQNVYVDILHVVSPSKFYVMETAKADKFRNMEAELDKYARKKHKCAPDTLVKRKMCLAKHQDKWYRARILNSFKNENEEIVYKVNFIDYGNTSELQLNDIRSIPAQYESIPSIVLECGLHDIEPKDGQWTLDANKALETILKEPGSIYINVHNYQNTKFIVDLYKSMIKGHQTISVRECLIFQGHGSFVRFDKLRRLNPLSVRKLFYEDLTIQNYNSVICTYIDTPVVFWVQKTNEENQRFIANLERKLAVELERNETAKILLPEVGMIVAAPGATKGTWGRAKIISIPEPKKVEVLLVDHGGKRIIRYDSIRYLHPQYLTGKTQAIKIHLKDVHPTVDGEFRASAKNCAILKLLNREMSVFVYEKIEYSETREATFLSAVFLENNENFAELMAAEKHVFYGELTVSTTDAAIVNLTPQYNMKPKKSKKVFRVKETKYSTMVGNTKKSFPDNNNEFPPLPQKITNSGMLALPKIISSTSQPERSVVTTAASVTVGKPKPPAYQDDPFSIQVKIERVESPDCIYVSEIARQTDYLQMQSDMKEFYINHCSITEEQFKEGDSCVAYSEKDKAFMRVKIVEVLPETKVSAYFYDLAITEEVSFEDLQPLAKQFFSLPFYVFKIKLAGISPCGGRNVWPTTTTDKLKDIISDNYNCKFYITKIGETNDDASIPVDLTMKLFITDGPLVPTRVEMLSINRILLDEGVALPVKGKSEVNGKKTLAIELKKELISHQPTEFNQCNDAEDGNYFNANQNSYFDNSAIKYNKIKLKEKPFTTIPLPPEDADWMPALPVEIDQFEAVATYVDYDCNVYLHIKEREKTIKNIRDALNNHFDNIEESSEDQTWREGEICIAQYLHDNMWYRAKILKVQNEGHCRVQFVDYGNEEDCPVSTLKKRVILLGVPIQVTKCEIYGLKPSGSKFTTHQLDVIHEAIVDHPLSVECLKRNKDMLTISVILENIKKDFVAHIYEDKMIPIRTTLASEFDTSSISSDQTNNAFQYNDFDDSSESIIVEQVKNVSLVSQHNNETSFNNDDVSKCSNSSDNNSSEKQLINNGTSLSSNDTKCCYGSKLSEESCIISPYSIVDFKSFGPETILELEISGLHSSNRIWGHLNENSHLPLLNAYHKNYTRMMKELQKVCKFKPKLRNVRIGMPCCALFDDDLWYRCEIISLNQQKNEVIIKYVDYGNEKVCSINELRSLDPVWLKIPALGDLFKLWNLKSAEDSQMFINALRYKFHELFDKYPTVFAKIKSAIKELEVELYTDFDCRNLAYASFIEDGYLAYEDLDL